jgi:hypothetical protein
LLANALPMPEVAPMMRTFLYGNVIARLTSGIRHEVFSSYGATGDLFIFYAPVQTFYVH